MYERSPQKSPQLTILSLGPRACVHADNLEYIDSVRMARERNFDHRPVVPEHFLQVGEK